MSQAQQFLVSTMAEPGTGATATDPKCRQTSGVNASADSSATTIARPHEGPTHFLHPAGTKPCRTAYRSPGRNLWPNGGSAGAAASSSITWSYSAIATLFGSLAPTSPISTRTALISASVRTLHVVGP